MMILFSPPGLKYAAAHPATMMTCLMVNRLTLSLRQYYETEELDCTELATPVFATGTGPRTGRRRSWIGTSTFEAIEKMHVQDSLAPDHGSGTFELHVDVASGRRREEWEFHSEADSTRIVRDA